MFNPHIHQQQQQQQQQQFHQHLRQLQQLFQQQPPPPPPPQPPPGHHVAHHHHQTPRAIQVPAPQTAPPPRMVNLCQASQTTIIAPNPMLQGALLMQQMQGNMRGFGMGGQQFRQFFAASARSSLLGPVPMGMAIKSPMMGFPAARAFHPHARYYNNTAATTASTSSSSSSSFYSSSTTSTDAAARQPDRKRDSEQMAAGSADDQPTASATAEATEKTDTDGAVGGVDEPTRSSEDQLEEPVVKKQRTDGPEEPGEQCVVEPIAIADADGEALFSECNSNPEDSQLDDCLLEDGGSTGGSDAVEALEEDRAAEEHICLPALSPSTRVSEDGQQVNLPAEETSQGKDAPFASPDNQEEAEEGAAEGANKFYCYLCSITCHNQQNFRSHMNSVSHQQRMMEIQHMSNACLVTLLPRVQESLQGAIKDGEKKEDLKHWCATCHTHFTSSITAHRRTEEHKLASRTAISTCTVCKKHFRTSQIFVEHLQSTEHRQKVEKLQEKEGSEALGKLTATDMDGFLLEEAEGSDVEEEEEEEERQRSEADQECSEKPDGCSSFKEVTLKDMTGEEQYDPDTVYGSRFFVPVAGFICRLCNKFYHFESSALHTHCKSLKHFEKLKSYRELLGQKGEAAASSMEALQPADGLQPVTEGTADCLDEDPHSDDTGLVTDPIEPVITPSPMSMQTDDQQQEEEQAVPDPVSQDSAFPSATSTDQDLQSTVEETTSQASTVQETPAEVSEEQADLEPAASAASAQESNEGVEVEAEAAAAAPAEEEVVEEEKEKEAPAAPGKKSDTGKAKATPKRRSGRATNKR